MKVLALLLLCATVAVQARSALKSVSLGDAPWLVHLRRAVSTTGALQTSAGALISERWVLTSKDAVDDARFIWIRYGTLTVINPSLVTETSAVAVSEGLLALVDTNRNVETTSYIMPAALIGGSVPSSGDLYLYGESAENVPGESLQVLTVTLESTDSAIVATSDDGKATKFDIGAPLVSEGVQIGVLVEAGDDEKAAVFAKVSDYLDWIQEESGIELCPGEDEDEDEDEDEQAYKVNFVN